MVNLMEDNQYESQENSGSIKSWIEDNLRVLLSILIVVVIAGGIYSYSKRSEGPMVDDLASVSSETMDDTKDDTEDDTEDTIETKAGDEIVTPKDTKVTDVNTSKETEDAFVESAQSGDGTTHLARRALANYLEKNPDSALTAEHKIYIEDYLRKNIEKQGNLSVGESVEFSKTLIQSSIEKSKTLNEKQLNNLKKYSARVPSLR